MEIKIQDVEPLHDRVIVEPIGKSEEVTKSGIILPATVQEEKAMGTVVAAGTGFSDKPMTVDVGDVVMYGKFAGLDIKVDNKTYLVMRESDILVRVKQNKE